MVDRNLQTGIRRCVIGMAGSLLVGLFAVFMLVGIAAIDPATGADAVSAALAVGLALCCAGAFERRRQQWRHLKAMVPRSPGN